METPQEKPTEDELLNAAQVGQMLGCVSRYPLQLAAERKLACIRLGKKCVRFRRSDVLAYIESKREEALAS